MRLIADEVERLRGQAEALQRSGDLAAASDMLYGQIPTLEMALYEVGHAFLVHETEDQLVFKDARGRYWSASRVDDLSLLDGKWAGAEMLNELERYFDGQLSDYRAESGTTLAEAADFQYDLLSEYLFTAKQHGAIRLLDGALIPSDVFAIFAERRRRDLVGRGATRD